jgi:putative ABC transport system permease protein
VSAAVTALAEGVIRMMWLARLKPLVAVAAALILTTAGVAVQGRQQPAPEGARKQAPTQGVDRPARAASGKTVSPPKPTYIEVRSVLSSAEKQTIPPVRVVHYGLKYQDFDRLMAAVTTVTRAVPIRERPRQIRRQEHAIECRVVGTTHDYAAVTGLEMDRGRFLADADVTRFEADRERIPFPDTDNAAALYQVVVSSEVAQALFPGEDPVGKPVQVGTDHYTVVGVVKQPKDLKDIVYMPLMTSRIRFGERIVDNRSGKLEAVETQLSRLILEVRDGADVEATAALVKSTLQPHHPRGDVEVVILKPGRKTR